MNCEKNLNFDEVVNRKNTDCLKYDFAARRGKPEDILPLWVADMDFKTSSRVLDALKERVEHGIFGYTEVGTSYFEALASWMKKHHDLEIEENWVVKTPGVVFALAAAVRALTNEGDAVMLEQPVYYPMSEVIVDNNRKLVSSDLVIIDGKYHMDFADFEAGIVKNNVKLFMLCNPHNPVGRVWTADELKRVAEICIKHDVFIISDEIHEDFVYPGHRHISILNVDERLKDRSITCTSPSKTFNLAGMQTSNAFIPNSEIRRKIKKEIAAAGYSQMNTLGLTACEAAYRYGEEWHRAVCEYIYGNLNFVRDYLKRNIPDIKLIEPEGTYLIWLDMRKLGLSADDLDKAVVNTAGLWLDKGDLFGPSGEGFQRINLATSRTVLAEAMERLKKIKNFK